MLLPVSAVRSVWLSAAAQAAACKVVAAKPKKNCLNRVINHLILTMPGWQAMR